MINKKAIILASGLGTRCGTIPKGLLKINDETLIERQINQLNSIGIADIVIVTGAFDKELQKNIEDVTFVYNPDFLQENSLSLKMGLQQTGFDSDIILMMGDIIIDTVLLQKLSDRLTSTYLVDENKKIEKTDWGVEIADRTIVGFTRESCIGDVGVIKLNKEILSNLYINLDGKKSCGFYFLKYFLAPGYIASYKWHEIDTLKDYEDAKKLFSITVKKQEKVDVVILLELINTMDFPGFHLENRDFVRETKAIKNSISFCAYEDEKLIGYLRVFGDKEYYWSIWDVMVHPDYQNLGLGKRLLEEAIAYIKKQNPIKIFLFSAKGKESFYKQFGFNTSRATVMEIRND